MTVQINPSAPAGLAKQAATPFAGFALVNGTGPIVSWTTPNDGKLHRVSVFGTYNVTSAMTGGNVYLDGFDPLGNPIQEPMLTPQSGVQSYWINFPYTVVVQPNSLVTINQQIALTAGACTVWAEIWGQ